MTEHELQNQIRAALSEYGKVFRMNAGQFWQGKRVFSREFQAEVLLGPRRVEGLPEGFPDLLFLDGRGAAFIEVKTKAGRVSAQQKHFLETMRRDGHRAGVARSVGDALAIIRADTFSGNVSQDGDRTERV